MSSKKPKEEEKEENKPKEEPKKEEKKRPDARRDIPTNIIRVIGTDLDGGKPVARAIRKIKGIGLTMSSAICNVANIDPNTKLGSLNETQMADLERVIKNPEKFGIPTFLVNRRRDPESGNDTHITASDLDIAKRFDIQRYVNLRTYKGWRHMLGQPVRGQRTRSTFRNKGSTVGVIKKATVPQKTPAPAPAPAAPAKPAGKEAKK